MISTKLLTTSTTSFSSKNLKKMKTVVIIIGLTLLSAMILMMPACTDDPILGCTVPCASNFDADAEEDDGSCTGCTNSSAVNYCSGALFNDNSCVLPCEANQTGEVFFRNLSNTNSTYDIIWDGVKIATVGPGQDSNTFTVTANVGHTLVFQFTNTSNSACNPSTPVIPQCQELWFSCTG